MGLGWGWDWGNLGGQLGVKELCGGQTSPTHGRDVGEKNAEDDCP